MTDERRYDEREVRLILRRVAELDEGDREDTRTMTRVQLEQVVGELGISKALVARAVSEISGQDLRNRTVWWLGGKTELMFETMIDRPIDEVTLSRMLEVLRRHLADPGELKREGPARIWSTTPSTARRIYLSVVEHTGTTTIRLEERMPVDAHSTVAAPTFVGGFGAFIAMVPFKALLGKALLLLAMGPASAVGAAVGWLVGRAWWQRRSAQRQQQLQRAFGEVFALAESPRALPQPPPTSGLLNETTASALTPSRTDAPINSGAPRVAQDS